MSMCVRILLLFVQLYGDVTGNMIYKETIAEDNCTYSHICSLEIVPARSLVECAMIVSDADSELLFYDATERTCSVCHPTSSNGHQLARGQRFYIRGKCQLWQMPLMLIKTFTASFVRTNINNSNYITNLYDQTLMTSSNGNIFRVTGLLCGEFTGHRWNPLTKASDAELWCFWGFSSATE